jgi:predicted amidohydrolase
MDCPENLHIALFQFDIEWENKKSNLEKVRQSLLSLKGKTHLLILPEMFTTGFSMNAQKLAETDSGETITSLKEWSASYDIAIVGSYIAKDDAGFYNKAFFITPQQEVFFYDKHHLFSIGTENTIFSAGNKKVIVPYRGWNICMQICYDLRFPVWSRNVNNEYDLLIYVANWPTSRISAWNTLLPARAVENLAYVCGVNRVGVDGMNLCYNGCSSVYDMKGELMVSIAPDIEEIILMELSFYKLKKFRNKFPIWKDSDNFQLLDS